MRHIKSVLRFVLLASIFLFASRSPAQQNPAPAPAAQAVPVPARITQAIDEKNLVTLRGNVHPLARAEFDQGPVADSQPLKRMLLLLQRSPDQEASLQQLLDDQQNKSSANYHAWLTPDQFGKQFGPADADIQTVTQWLTSHGFTDIKVGPGRNIIEFSGNVAAVRGAFHTDIHRFLVNGEAHQANASDPQIPAALAPVVAGIVSLHNFPRKPMHRVLGVFNRSKDTNQVKLVKPANPELTYQCNFNPNTGQPIYCNALVPYDFAAIYNVLPLWSGTPAIDGTGQTIAIVNESNINVQDVRNFRTSFGLPANDPIVVLNGPDPGIVPGLETEADLDVEWSGGVAKGATIKLVVSQSTETSAGVDLSAEYVVDNNLAPILSESFGECELNLGTAGNQFYNDLWQQAAAQGISVFVSSGDNGSAGCDFNFGQVPQPAQKGLQVSGFASTPYNIAVGGTDFNDFFNPTTYFNTTNDPTTQQSARGYIPETTWNDSCTNAIFGDPRIGFSTNAETNCNNFQLSGFVFTIGGSGGKSSCTTPSGQMPSSCAGGYTKPSWQIGSGVPLDGKRDVPDVSLFASDGFLNNFYAICEADITGPCSSTNFLGVGGTSASAPAFAGVMAMVNQKTQSPQGNANVVLYKLATKQNATNCNSSSGPASTCVFNDVTSGTIAMPCAKGTTNCTTSNSNDLYGILSGYNAGAAYDLSTGLGSVNVQNLVNNWSSVTFLPSATTLSASVNGAAASPISVAHGTPVAVTSNVSAGSGATGTPTGQVALIAAPNPTPGNPSSSLGIEALTLSNGTATGSGVILPGGSYNLTAHYQGDATFGSSDSTPGIPVSITAENSKTIISIPTFDPTTGLETGNTPTSLVYGSPYIARIDVGNAQAALSFPPKPICTPQSCATGTISLTDSFNGAPAAPLDGGTFGLNSEGFTEDQPIQLSGGSHVLSASYSGDNSYKPSSNTYPITVTPAPTGVFIQVIGSPIVSGVPFQVQISGGAQTPSGLTSTAAAPTGTITLFDGTTQLGSPITVSGTGGRFPGFNIFTSLTLPTGGAHTLNANYSGDSNYAPSSFSGGNVFVLWQTTPAINLSATNINYGQSVTVTASVATSGKTPPMTGTFTFFGSFTSIPGPVTPTLTTDASGNQTLSATVTTTPQDSENIQLTYSGDTNYARASAFSNFINVNIPDFTLQNATITVTAGQSQTATVNVTPLSSVPSPVTLSAGSFVSLPPGMSLSFNPSTASLNGAPVPVVITLTTTGPSGGPSAAAPVIPVARPILEHRRWIWWPGTLATGLLLLILLAMPQWRKRSKVILAASAAFLVTLALGCGGGNSGGGGGGGGGPVPTSITLTTSQAKVASGASFTLTAMVTSTKTLTGTVNIFQGHPPSGQGVAPPIQVVNGTASTTVMNPFGPGTYEYWAQYTGDPNNLPSQTTTSVQEVLTGTTTAVYAGQTGGLTHQAQITVNLQ